MESNNKMSVIFDLDGVLADTSAFHKQAWFDLAEKENFRMSDEFFSRTFGMQNYQIISLLAGKNLPAKEIERMSFWKETRYRQLVKGQLSLAGGAKELIEELKEKRFKTAIGTSTPRANLDFMLKEMKAEKYFDVLVTGEDVKRGKPAPDTFLKAAEKLSVHPGRCIVIEDAVHGIEAGKNAGMAVIAITSTRERQDLKPADLIVDSLTELSASDFVNLLKKQNQ